MPAKANLPFSRSASLRLGPVRLRSGAVLHDVAVAYVAQGRLNPDGSNAILVTHGYTSSHFMLSHGGTTAEGSWAGLAGAGRPLDPSTFFIVCANMLGSSYGTTGPASIDPHTHRPYGPDFPDIDVSDMVQVQRLLLQRLGVRRLRAVVGPSYGGFQALQWALDYPDMVDAVGVVLSGPYLPPHPQMDLGRLTRALQANPAWNQGRYAAGTDMHETLTRLRIDNLCAHGTLEVLAAQGVPAPQRQAEVRRQAEQWAAGFDANALIVLLKAGQRFDVRAHLPRIQCPVLQVLSTTDTLFPADGSCDLRSVARLRSVVLETQFGHQASGVAYRCWIAALAALIDHAD